MKIKNSNLPRIPSNCYPKGVCTGHYTYSYYRSSLFLEDAPFFQGFYYSIDYEDIVNRLLSARGASGVDLNKYHWDRYETPLPCSDSLWVLCSHRKFNFFPFMPSMTVPIFNEDVWSDFKEFKLEPSVCDFNCYFFSKKKEVKSPKQYYGLYGKRCSPNDAKILPGSFSVEGFVEYSKNPFDINFVNINQPELGKFDFFVSSGFQPIFSEKLVMYLLDCDSNLQFDPVLGIDLGGVGP